MRRIDYRTTWIERHAGFAPPRGVAAALRGPLAVLACALAFGAVVHVLEVQRLADAERTGAAFTRALARIAPAVDAVRALERDVVRRRAAARALGAVRRSGTDSANAAVRITDRLPDDAWLTSLRNEHTVVALDGRAARLQTVAAALSALDGAQAGRSARLLSARAEAGRNGVVFAIALEPAP